MCLSSDAYVAALVEQRLVSRGVDPARAAAVGRKVGDAYALRRRQRAAGWDAAATGSKLADVGRVGESVELGRA
jgi:hypothetical protein